MFNKTRMKSESGSILLSALIISAIIAIFGGVVATRIQTTNELTQLPRVRAVMAQIEIQTRIVAYSAASYDCSYTSGNSGYKCDIKSKAIENLKADVDGGTVAVDQVSLDAAGVFHARIQYTQAGSDPRVMIAPRVIDIEVPSEVLQPVNFRCPASAPLFVGYSDGRDGQSKGSARCRAIPSTPCPVGHYIAAIDPETLKTTCRVAGGPVSCQNNEYISMFRWNNGGDVYRECSPRKDPFSEMGFDVSRTLAIETSYSADDPDRPNPTPPPLPAPEIVTWSNPNPQPASFCYAPPPVSCVGNWGACSRTCGGGTSTYLVSTPASNGGAACPHNNGEVMQCNTQACPTPAPTAPPVSENCMCPAIQISGRTWVQCGQGLRSGSTCLVDAYLSNTPPRIGCTMASELGLPDSCTVATVPVTTPPPAPTPDAGESCWIRVTVTAGGPPMYDTRNWDGLFHSAECPTRPGGYFNCNRSNNGETTAQCGPGTDGTQGMKGRMQCMCP